MSPSVVQIVSDFYDAAWDLAECLALLAQESQDVDHAKVTPESLIHIFREKAHPFMDLTGAQIPPSLHFIYDQVDMIIRDSVFPAMQFMSHEWARIKTSEPIEDNEEQPYDMVIAGCVV